MDSEHKPNKLSFHQTINLILIIFIFILTFIYFRNDFKQIINSMEGNDSKVIVNIEGAIVNPGVYEMKEGMRVGDLILESGGFTPDADIEKIALELNKAQKLKDSEKIFIPFIKQNLSQNTSNINQNINSFIKINVNTDSQANLENLPGIGSVSAKKIIDNRTYLNIDDFSSKSGLNKSQIEGIRDLIVF